MEHLVIVVRHASPGFQLYLNRQKQARNDAGNAADNSFHATLLSVVSVVKEAEISAKSL
jgi:hypothetical protein